MWKKLTKGNLGGKGLPGPHSHITVHHWEAELKERLRRNTAYWINAPRLLAYAVQVPQPKDGTASSTSTRKMPQRCALRPIPHTRAPFPGGQGDRTNPDLATDAATIRTQTFGPTEKEDRRLVKLSATHMVEGETQLLWPIFWPPHALWCKQPHMYKHISH